MRRLQWKGETEMTAVLKPKSEYEKLDFEKIEFAIAEIEFYMDFYPNGSKRPKEQRHLCFALEWLKQLQGKRK